MPLRRCWTSVTAPVSSGDWWDWWLEEGTTQVFSKENRSRNRLKPHSSLLVFPAVDRNFGPLHLHRRQPLLGELVSQGYGGLAGRACRRHYTRHGIYAPDC
jgi:hypothetical protein